LENVAVVSRLRVVIAQLHFRFGGVVAADGALGAKGETGAPAVDFTVFGFRFSRLPRRFSLAIFSPSGSGLRRPGN